MTLLDTYKEKWRAQKDADMRNAAEEHDTQWGLPPRRYFYVKPVTEEQLMEEKKEKHKRHSEEWRSLERRFHEKLQPVCREIATAVVFAIETCEEQHLDRLRKDGGYIDCYKGTVDEAGSIACSLLFSGNDIILELTLRNNEEIDSIAVEKFSVVWLLRSWLLGIQGAAAACENRLIEMLYDRWHFSNK